jgi:hypothetical protein
MKLLKLDSSLNARKQLAQELGYKGALTGSVEMNIWLHEQVIQKLVESGMETGNLFKRQWHGRSYLPGSPGAPLRCAP